MDTKDKKRKTYDWRQEIQIDYKFHVYRDKIFKIKEEFEAIWGRHLGRIIVAKTRIELAPGQKTRALGPYRTGLKALEFEK